AGRPDPAGGTPPSTTPARRSWRPPRRGSQWAIRPDRTVTTTSTNHEKIASETREATPATPRTIKAGNPYPRYALLANGGTDTEWNLHLAQEHQRELTNRHWPGLHSVGMISLLERSRPHFLDDHLPVPVGALLARRIRRSG